MENSNRGFVLLWRQYWDDEELKEPGRQFSKREAWLYLFSNLANGIDRNGIPRGQFEASERYLSKCWRWSKTKVHLFLQLLEKNGKIKRVLRNEISQDHQKDHLTDRFIICNYDTYQKAQTAPQTAEKTKSNKGIKESINKEIKEEQKILIEVPLKDGSNFGISEQIIEQYKTAYPSVDVMQQIARYKAWALSNPQKQKTRSGILRSVNAWLADKQDTPGAANLFAGLGKIGQMK